MKFSKPHLTGAVITSISLAALTACGGGGGGGGAPAPVGAASLTSSNQTVASQDVASTALGLLTTSQLALGAVSTNESSLYATAFAHLDRLPIYLSDAVAKPTAIGVIQSASYNCTYGGVFTASVTDADNSSTVTTGDSISLSFTNCNEGSGAVGGNLSFHIDSLNGVYGAIPSNVAVSMTFGNLGVTSNSYSASILGSITVSGARTGTNELTQSISTSSLSASATYGSVTRSRALTSFSASESRVADATYTYLSRYSIAGTLSSSGFSGTQAVSFNTPTTLIRRGTDVYPYTGVLQIGGANNSALLLTVISNSQVREDLDANGDGTYESTTAVNWNTLL